VQSQDALLEVGGWERRDLQAPEELGLHSHRWPLLVDPETNDLGRFSKQYLISRKCLVKSVLAALCLSEVHAGGGGGVGGAREPPGGDGPQPGGSRLLPGCHAGGTTRKEGAARPCHSTPQAACTCETSSHKRLPSVYRAQTSWQASLRQLHLTLIQSYASLSAIPSYDLPMQKRGTHAVFFRRAKFVSMAQPNSVSFSLAALPGAVRCSRPPSGQAAGGAPAAHPCCHSRVGSGQGPPPLGKNPRAAPDKRCHLWRLFGSSRLPAQKDFLHNRCHPTQVAYCEDSFCRCCSLLR
jgi:hypothetical protein